MSSQMPKKAVKSLDQSEFVVASTMTAKSSVAVKLTEVYAPTRSGDGQGPPMTDFDAAQESNAALLGHASGEVRRTQQVYGAARVQVSKARDQRKQQFQRVKEVHRDVRKSVEGTHGEAALLLVGLEAAPARTITAAREQTLEAVGRMRNPELVAQVPGARAGQEPLDFEHLANALEAEVLKLDEAMAAVKNAVKLADQALVAKKQALAYHRRVYVNVARIQEAYFRLAGFDDLAERIRVAEPVRRTEKPAEAPEETPEPTSPSPLPEEEAPVTA